MKLIEISEGGVWQTHIPGFDGNYASLCGLDGDENPTRDAVSQVVDCPKCGQIYKHCKLFRAARIKE